MAADQERADRIRALKQSRPDLTWRRIADYVGVTERSATDWQSKGGIEYDNAKKLAELFEVDVDYIWRGPSEADRAPSPFAGQDALADMADRLTAIEDALNAGRKERVDQAANIERLLKRQDAILETIQARLREQQAVRDEIADLIEAHGQGIVQGRPAAEPDPAPVPPRSQAAATKRAAKQRTP